MNRPSEKLLLRNANVVLSNRTIPHASILVEDGVITSINETGATEITEARTLDLDGLTVLPGFIDVHIHGAAGVDVMEASTEGLKEVSRYLASQGVIGWLP